MQRTIDLRKQKIESPHEAVAPTERALTTPPGENYSPPLPTVESAILVWNALEFEYQPERHLLLFASGLIFILGGLGVLFFFKNFLFAIFLLISGGLVIAHAFRQPRLVHFSITPRGIDIAGKFHEFANFTSFWIFYDPPFAKELSLIAKRSFLPMMRVPLGELDPIRLRKILLGFLREEEHEESFIDILAKRLGL